MARSPASASAHARLVPRRAAPARPARTPPGPAKPAAPDPRAMAAGRRAGLVLAGVGLLWVLVTWAGGALGWPNRLRALCDLAALAGFGVALYLTYQAYRLNRAGRGASDA